MLGTGNKTVNGKKAFAFKKRDLLMWWTTINNTG